MDDFFDDDREYYTDDLEDWERDRLAEDLALENAERPDEADCDECTEENCDNCPFV